MWEELGISSGNFVVLMTVAYFVIKSAVKNGVKAAIISLKSKGDSQAEPNSSL